MAFELLFCGKSPCIMLLGNETPPSKDLHRSPQTKVDELSCLFSTLNSGPLQPFFQVRSRWNSTYTLIENAHVRASIRELQR